MSWHSCSLENDRMVSYDIVSLYTKIPVDEAIEVIRRLTDSETRNLVEVSLRSTYFSFQEDIYEQTNGVAMGSPLSPIIANIYMENFEEKAIGTSPMKPEHWIRYVDEKHFILSHGDDRLKDFLQHMNSQSEAIQFTMEEEVDKKLPFLDVFLTRNPDGSLSHQVYRKKTHTDKYIQANSHHHPAPKIGVINTGK